MEAHTQDSGVILQRFRDEFASEERFQARRTKTDVYDLLTRQAAQSKPGANGLLFFSMYNGSNAPVNQPYGAGGLVVFTSCGTLLKSFLKETFKIPKKLYRKNLNDEEHQSLLEMTHKGKIKARQMKRAMILLKADEGLSDPQIMTALNVSRPCMEWNRERFVLGGMEKALNEDPHPGQRRKLDGNKLY